MLYLLIFGIASAARAFLATAERQRFYFPLLVGLFLFSAFRFEVGCDWTGYLNQWRMVEFDIAGNVFDTQEPFWWLIMIFMEKLGLSYLWINVLSSLVFFAGIHKLAKRQPDPLSFLILLYPILILNMPMSGIRQATAIGLMCFAFSAFVDRKFIQYLAFTFAAVIIHSSAMVFVLMAPLAWGKVTWNRYILTGYIAVPILYAIVSSGSADTAVQRYVNSSAEAAGAVFRLAMTGIAAAMFLYFRKRWKSIFPQDFQFVTLATVLMLMLFLILPVSSVIADRFAYYLAPIQAMIFARLPFMQLRGSMAFLIWTPYIMLAVFLAGWIYFSPIFDACYEPYQTWLFGVPAYSTYTY